MQSGVPHRFPPVDYDLPPISAPVAEAAPSGRVMALLAGLIIGTMLSAGAFVWAAAYWRSAI